ncbi:MAG: C1 family peptidase [Acidobacteriota bacterium]
MQCYKCRKELPDRANECPACGQRVYTTASSPGASLGRRLDGCLAETPSPRDYTAVPNISSLPPRVDLRPGCSPVENQGQIGSCSANAIVGAVEFKRWKEGRQDDLSRLFVYFNARKMSGMEKEDCGARIAHGMAAFLAHGAPPESAWPYDPSRVTTMPDDAAYTRAAPNAEVEYARLSGIEHIRGALARQLPVVFSISLPSRCYDEAASGGVMPKPTDDEIAGVLTQHGRHAMLLVGYDTDQNIFHVRNSWGTEWGDRGYCRLSIDTFQRAMAADTAWVLGSLEASGAFSVTRPALTSPPVEGGVRDRAAGLRDEIRGGVVKDLDSALKGIRERVNPPRREG